MNRFRLLFLVAAASLVSLAMAQAVSTGEYSYQVDGTPAMTGQATHDHLFTQCEYNGQTFINKISFQSDNIQTVWFYLDDDEIYQNEAIQALSPIAYNAAGDLYNEITYNSFQCEIYLPEDIQIVTIADEDYNEVFYLQGDRLPTSSNIAWSWNCTKEVDGKTYNVYMVTCYNTNSFGSHFSAKNGTLYKRNGALKKESSLFALFLNNVSFDPVEGRFDQDMIIANQIFMLRETYIAGWEPNEARMFSAPSIWGPWTQHPNPCRGPKADKTFGGQSTYILTLADGRSIFMADIWRPRHPIDARYIWLPIEFEEGKPVIHWRDEWEL